MIAERAKRVPGVLAAGRTTIGVATDNNNNTGFMVPGNPEPITIGTYQVDEGFMDAMGLTLAAGRWFQEGRPMEDMTLPYPTEDESQRARAHRGGKNGRNEPATIRRRKESV